MRDDALRARLQGLPEQLDVVWMCDGELLMHHPTRRCELIDPTEVELAVGPTADGQPEQDRREEQMVMPLTAIADDGGEGDGVAAEAQESQAVSMAVCAPDRSSSHTSANIEGAMRLLASSSDADLRNAANLLQRSTCDPRLVALAAAVRSLPSALL